MLILTDNVFTVTSTVEAADPLTTENSAYGLGEVMNAIYN